MDFPVAVDFGVEMEGPAEPGAFGLGVFQDPSLDGFVFSGGGHEYQMHLSGQNVRVAETCRIGRMNGRIRAGRGLLLTTP